MKAWMVPWGVVVLALLPVTGCGDDEDDDGDGSAGAGGATTGATGGGGGTVGGGGGTQNVSCDPAGDGVCESDSDCPHVESGQARMSAQSCGLGCLGDPEQETCAVECIVMDTGITAECAACYAATVQCASDNCLAQCVDDPAGADCTQCQIDEGCRADFDDCSGLGD